MSALRRLSLAGLCLAATLPASTGWQTFSASAPAEAIEVAVARSGRGMAFTTGC